VADRAADIRRPHDDVGSIVSQPSARELPGTSSRLAAKASSVSRVNPPLRPSNTCSTVARERPDG
jgi:hypothetical protein